MTVLTRCLVSAFCLKDNITDAQLWGVLQNLGSSTQLAHPNIVTIKCIKISGFALHFLNVK